MVVKISWQSTLFQILRWLRWKKNRQNSSPFISSILLLFRRYFPQMKAVLCFTDIVSCSLKAIIIVPFLRQRYWGKVWLGYLAKVPKMRGYTSVCGNHSHASLRAQWYRIRLSRQETRVQSLGREDPLEKEMATQSSILAWRIPWTEEPGGLQSVGLQRVRHSLVTKQR